VGLTSVFATFKVLKFNVMLQNTLEPCFFNLFVCMFDVLENLIFNTKNVISTLAIWGLVVIIVPH
jgi:hypothetical protein